MLDTRLLGARIKELRKKKGLTQQRFAEEMNVSFQAVSNWERGIAPTDLENALRIASYFGILIDELFRARTEELFLGIDGGGTKTELAVVSRDGYVLRRVVKGGCNPNDVGFVKAVELISGSIADILKDFPSVSQVFLGIAGSTSGNYAKRLHTELSGIYPNVGFTVKSDAYNLLAIDESAGMAVISGTGSVVFAKHGDRYQRIGGWGYLLDEGGSAYDIGRDALREALKEEDMLIPHSTLSELLLKKLNTATLWEHVSEIYKGGKPYVASLAEVVFAAYKMGAGNAKSIIDKNAKALAELLNAGVSLYGAAPIAIASGGLFEHYTEIMTHHVGKYSDVELRVVDLPPIYGAAKSACLAAGRELSDDFYTNFKKTYGGTEK